MKEALKKALAAITAPQDPVKYRIYNPNLRLVGPFITPLNSPVPPPTNQSQSGGGRMTITCGPSVIDVSLSDERQGEIIDQALILMKNTSSRERAAGWQQTMLAAFTLIAGCILLAGIAEGLKNNTYNEP